MLYVYTNVLSKMKVDLKKLFFEFVKQSVGLGVQNGDKA